MLWHIKTCTERNGGWTGERAGGRAADNDFVDRVVARLSRGCARCARSTPGYSRPPLRGSGHEPVTHATLALRILYP
jgi:hypothetical protein